MDEMQDYDDTELRTLVNIDMAKSIQNLMYRTLQGQIQQATQILPALKNAGNIFMNTLKSVYASKDDPDFITSSAVSTLKQAHAKYREEVNAERQKSSGGIKKDIQELADAAIGKHAKYGADADTRLQTVLRDGIFFGNTALVVISKPPLSLPKLQRAHFSASSIHDGYIVLENQLVLGVHNAGLTDELADLISQRARGITDKGNNSEAARRRALAEIEKFKDEIQQDAEETALSAVQKKYAHLKLTPILTAANKPLHDSGASWYWMLPSQHYTILRRSTISTGEVSGLNLSRWNFASNYGSKQ